MFSQFQKKIFFQCKFYLENLIFTDKDLNNNFTDIVFDNDLTDIDYYNDFTNYLIP